MSTILDALKKSEQERKQNHLPTLSDMPVPEERARWPLYAIAVLSLLVALLIGVLIASWFGASKESNANYQASNGQIDAQPVNHGVDSNEVDVDDLVINVVSYSKDSTQRFVILNGKMFREHDFVRAGLKVQEIKPNAVVMNLRGELLTRTP